MSLDQKLLHDMNSCVNSMEQGFYMLRESQLEDPVLKDKLIELLAEKSKDLKKVWSSYKALEDIATTKAHS